MRKIFTLLIVAILATATSWAAEPYKTALFGKDYNSKAVNGYTDSWSATNAGFTVNLQNWNNYQNAWDYVKAGRKKEASVATITTAKAIDKAINKVAVTVSAATVASINSTKLYVASDANFSKDVQTITVTPAVGTLEFVVPNPAANQYYKFEANCDKKSNGLITVNKLEYYAADVPQKNVKSLAIIGEPTNKEYYVGDAFSTDGLKVNATYDDDTQGDVTAKATWTLAPATFTEAGAVSVTATATYGGVSAETTCPVTVKTIANTKETAYTVEQAIALIDAGKDLATPVYVKGIVSEITTPYSTQYKNISFNVSDDGTTTVPQFEFFRNQKDAENKYAEDPNIEVGATVIGYGILKKYNNTYEFDEGNYLVEYTAPVAKTLQSIAISGTPQTEYTEGETFSAEGLVVTATYDDASTAVVTTDATWTFEPATLAVGITSVTATATYNEKTASETYNVTVKEIPSYTYTWMVNGAEVKKSVLKEGAAVEAPANPENIDGKVFTGWVTTATVDANVAPTYATIDETAKANTTYYAVFATLKQGADEKWVKKAASEITEEGVYALITKDGYAFNGTIESGHGKSTAATFVFDKNNEATSAPEGTCELTFVKKGEGYSIYRDGTNIYKYLYSDGVGSGKLKWGVAEQNYWYYDETKGSWAYKVKATETAYLNVYNTNNTFRTYQSGATSPVYFAQKVAGAGYADFTTIVKAAEVTVAHEHTGRILGDIVQAVHAQRNAGHFQDALAPVGNVLVDDLLHKLGVSGSQCTLAAEQHAVMDDHVAK